MLSFKEFSFLFFSFGIQAKGAWSLRGLHMRGRADLEVSLWGVGEWANVKKNKNKSILICRFILFYFILFFHFRLGLQTPTLELRSAPDAR